MTDLDGKYMTREDIYREACTPRPVLSEHFVDSLRFRIIQDDPGRWDAEREQHYSQSWNVALRAALGEAWDSYTEAEYTREHPEGIDRAVQHYAFGQRYTAMKVIRGIARELYRHTVPADERIM